MTATARVGVVLVLALVVRLGVTAAVVGLDAPPDRDANPDQVDYETYAASLAAGHGYANAEGRLTALRPPGTSFTLLPAYLVGGHRYWVGRVWLGLLGAVTCVGIGALVGRLASPRAGLLAGLGLALYPGHFYYTLHFLSEGPFTFWTVGACAAALAGLRTRRWGWLVGAGLCLGMGMLTRPQALLVLPWAGLLAVLAPGRRRWLGAWAVVALVAVLVVSPWAWRNHRVLGVTTLSTIGGSTFWGAHNDYLLAHPELVGYWVPINDLVPPAERVDGTEVERDQEMWARGKRFVRAHPGDMPWFLARKLLRLVTPWHADTDNLPVRWTFALAWVVVGPLTLLGIGVLWRRDRLATAVLLLPVLAAVSTALVFYGSIRFRDSVAPILVAFAAIAVTRWWPGPAEEVRPCSR